MLAQSFMSAAELNITEAQKDALIKTLVLMETGKLVHQEMPAHTGADKGEFTGHFNMGWWHEKSSDCGTICCIGGTAELVGNVSFEGFWHGDLKELFMPNDWSMWSKITVPQAARALRSYLTVGKANWAAAMEVA